MLGSLAWEIGESRVLGCNGTLFTEDCHVRADGVDDRGLSLVTCPLGRVADSLSFMLMCIYY
jgi:hypothetical protein